MLLVESSAGRILVTGDIESSAEKRLLAIAREQLQSDLLVIPHHGSNTSSLPAFVTSSKPDFALVATGYLNRYRFPRPDVVSRWERAGARVINTAHSGAIHFRFERSGRIVGPVLYRRHVRRYWTHAPTLR